MIRVTEALKLAGFIDGEWFTEEGRQRGTAVHAATALDDAGELDEATVDPRVAPFLESYRLFRRQKPSMVVVEVEMEVSHVPMGFVGHLDRVVRFEDGGPLVVIDLKCGGPEDWHGVQTAGYAIGYAFASGCPTPLRGALYLQGDGSAARWQPHNDRRDFDVFKAAVTVANFRRRSA